MGRRLSCLRFAWLVVSTAASGAPLPPIPVAHGFNVLAVIPLPGVEGRLDHLAYDPVDQIVFIAELGNDTVGAVNVATRRVEHRVTGFHEPQGVDYSPVLERLYVASGDGKVQSFRRGYLTLDRSVNIGADADNVRIDEKAGRVYVGHGAGAIAVLDARTLALLADIPLRAHPESFQLATQDERIFVNVPDANEIAVLDRTRAQQVGHWPNGGPRSNYPLAVDAAGGRLVSVFRQPARLVSRDLARGTVVSDVCTCADADDVFIDERRHRIYVVCGEGAVEVFSNPDLAKIARLPTAPGARTGLFRPDVDQLFVAARANGGSAAALWILAPAP